MTDNLIELIDLIQKRPALYLSRATISALKAFLDGWQMRCPDTILNKEILSRLQSHVEDFYEINGHSWDKIILLFSQDENDALSNFFIRYNEVKKIYND